MQATDSEGVNPEMIAIVAHRKKQVVELLSRKLAVAQESQLEKRPSCPGVRIGSAKRMLVLEDQWNGASADFEGRQSNPPTQQFQ